MQYMLSVSHCQGSAKKLEAYQSKPSRKEHPKQTGLEDDPLLTEALHLKAKRAQGNKLLEPRAEARQSKLGWLSGPSYGTREKISLRGEPPRSKWKRTERELERKRVVLHVHAHVLR